MTAIRLPSWSEVVDGPWAAHLRAGSAGLWLMRMEAEEVEDLTARFVAGGACTTSSDLFDEFAAALEFPDYFGRNWDAFDECMRDLDWLRPGPVALLVTDAHRLLGHEPTRLRTLVEVLYAAEQQLTRPFRVVFQARELEPDAQALFAEFGVAEIA